MVLSPGARCIDGEVESQIWGADVKICLENVKNFKFEIFLMHSNEEHQIGSWLYKYGYLRRMLYSYKFGAFSLAMELNIGNDEITWGRIQRKRKKSKRRKEGRKRGR